MPVIELNTNIAAPIQLVFNLSRNMDMHQRSMSHTKEKAIAGKTTGLIELGETVTWKARHFGINQKLTVKITEFDSPFFFVDEQIKGIFKSFRHEHYFQENKSEDYIETIKQKIQKENIAVKQKLLKRISKKNKVNRPYFIINISFSSNCQSSA